MRNDFAIQLYSLRDITKDGYEKGLKLVSDLGFKNVELAGTYDLSAPEMKKVMDSYGLQVISAHIGISGNPDDYKKTAEYLQGVGCNSIVCPYCNFSLSDEECKVGFEKLRQAFEVYKDCGMKFGFHNHSCELRKFEGDKRIIDFIADTGCYLQPDIFWVNYADNDPYELLKKYAGQIISLHFKESDKDKNNVEFGNGNYFDWHKIDELGKKAGAEYNILEQECYTMPVAESITECAKNINKMFK